jgi:hypothetical protein
MKKKLAKVMAVLLVIGFLAVSVAMAGEQIITGTVQQTDQGIVISADDGASYLVQGQDLSAMVGKTLKATGTLEEGASGKTLTVTSVEEISE